MAALIGRKHMCKIKRILWLLLLCGYFQDINAADTVVNGIADLRAYDFTRQDSVTLNGWWNFYWMQWITHPDEDKAGTTNLCFVPGYWYTCFTDGQHPSNFGYATYRVRIKLPAQTMHYGLKLPAIASAYTLYINDEKIHAMGSIGKYRDAMFPVLKPVVIPLPALDKEIDVIIHIANYFNKSSGITFPVQFGAYARLVKNSMRIVITNFIFSALVLLNMLLLIYCIIRFKKEHGFLFLLLFSITVLIDINMFDDMNIYYLFASISFISIIKLSSLSTFMNGALLLFLIASRFAREVKKIIVYIAVVYLFFVLFTMLYFDFYNFENFPVAGNTEFYSIFFMYLSNAFYLYGVFVLIKALKKKRKGALLHFVLILAYSITAYIGYTFYYQFEVSIIHPAALILLFTISLYYYRQSSQASIPNSGIDPKETFIKALPLSGREQAILQRLLEGKCSKEMADELKLSVRTVENHTYRIFKKCRIKSRAEMLTRYYDYQAAHKEAIRKHPERG